MKRYYLYTYFFMGGFLLLPFIFPCRLIPPNLTKYFYKSSHNHLFSPLLNTDLFSGLHYPIIPTDSVEIAKLVTLLESSIRDPHLSQNILPRLAHQQQIVYRFLSNSYCSIKCNYECY